jgi:hypothetical protein
LVDFFISQHSDHLVEAKIVPQESLRRGVPRAFLDTAVESFRGHVHNSCAELVFNLDEIGISEWEERAPGTVIIP